MVGQALKVTESILIGKYHAYLLKEGKQATWELIYTGTAIALLPKGKRQAFMLRRHGYMPMLEKVIAQELRRARPIWPKDLLTRVVRKAKKTVWGRQRVAVLIGDTRPLHFLADCASYLYEQRERIRAIRPKPLVLQTPSMAFIDLQLLFPDAIDVVNVEISKINQYCVDNELLLLNGLRPKRNSEATAREFLEWLGKRFNRTRFPVEAPGPHDFPVSIGLDVEKNRFVGQDEFLSLLLLRLRDHAAKKGKRLVVYWDGWTPKSAKPRSADLAMIKRLNAYAADVEERFRPVDASVVFRPIYTHTLTQKIAFFGLIEIFFATRGTASLLPGVMYGKPGFTYHNPNELKRKLPFRYLRAITLKPAKARFVSERQGEPKHMWEYTFDLDAVPTIEEIMAHSKLRTARAAPKFPLSPQSAAD